MLVWLGEASVDGICVHCGEHIVGGVFHGVCSVSTGAGGVGVVGATAAGGLVAWAVEAYADAADATLLMLDVSGFTASR